MKLKPVVLILVAVAFVYALSPWPTLWLTEWLSVDVVLPRLNPACLNPLALCNAPFFHEIYLLYLCSFREGVEA